MGADALPCCGNPWKDLGGGLCAPVFQKVKGLHVQLGPHLPLKFALMCASHSEGHSEMS